MKKIIAIILVVFMVLAFVGCGATKIVHCDKCGAEVEVEADSNMAEDWAVFCEKCATEMIAENPELEITAAE